MLLLIGPQFDVSSIAGLPDPVLKTFFRFALADGDLGLHPVAVGGHVLLAPLQYFDQMPAEGRAHRGRYLVEGELAQRFFERGHHIAGIDPAEIAALGRARVLGIEPGQIRELGAGVESVLEALGLVLGVGLGSDLVDADQDVPRVH